MILGDKIQHRLLTALAICWILIIALGIFVRDGRAVGRCQDLGGQTWDSGRHCVLGHPKVVSTR